jgi:hypothetical protein
VNKHKKAKLLKIIAEGVPAACSGLSKDFISIREFIVATSGMTSTPYDDIHVLVGDGFAKRVPLECNREIMGLAITELGWDYAASLGYLPGEVQTRKSERRHKALHTTAVLSFAAANFGSGWLMLACFTQYLDSLGVVLTGTPVMVLWGIYFAAMRRL